MLKRMGLPLFSANHFRVIYKRMAETLKRLAAFGYSELQMAGGFGSFALIAGKAGIATNGIYGDIPEKAPQ